MKNQFKSFFNKNKYFIVSICFVLILFVLWELVVKLFNIPFYVLPKFSNVTKAFFDLFGQRAFYQALGGTLLRILITLILAILVGVSFGFLSVNGYIRACFRPLVASIKSVTVMAITIVIFLATDRERAPLIIGFLMAFPIMYNHTVLGVDSIDVKLIEMAKVYKVSKKDMLFKIRLPQVLPSIFTGIETSGGMCVKAVISAEILCYTVNSIGLKMHILKTNFASEQDMATLFAYCLVAVLLSLLIELVVKIVAKGVLKWK